MMLKLSLDPSDFYRVTFTVSHCVVIEFQGIVIAPKNGESLRMVYVIYKDIFMPDCNPKSADPTMPVAARK